MKVLMIFEYITCLGCTLVKEFGGDKNGLS